MDRWTVISASGLSVGLAATPRGLSEVVLLDGSLTSARAEMARRYPDGSRDDGLLPELQQQLRDYFAGQPVTFDVPVDLSRVTPFQKKALEACAGLDYGRTATYGELAARLGTPRGARAVGGAMARNPVPIVIPCHRVVGGHGGLGGYSAAQGVALKRRLLDMESRAQALSGR